MVVDRSPGPRWTRRRFLTSTGGLVLAGSVAGSLAGCSSDTTVAETPPQLAALFSNSFVLAAGLEQRIPFALIDQGQILADEQGSYPVRILRDGVEVVSMSIQGRIVAHEHPDGNGDVEHQHASLLRYFALRATLPDPGIYDLILTVEGQEASLAFQVFDPAEVSVPLPGQMFPPVRFPTFAEPLGMGPICTQFDGPCPLHDQSLDAALGSGLPSALLIATPALCQTAYCGPVLDVMLELAPNYPAINFLHAEVYENSNEVGNNYLDENIRLAPTLIDLDLQFEPALFLLDPSGVIVDRIDNVYDNQELAEALDSLTA